MKYLKTVLVLLSVLALTSCDNQSDCDEQIREINDRYEVFFNYKNLSQSQIDRLIKDKEKAISMVKC